MNRTGLDFVEEEGSLTSSGGRPPMRAMDDMAEIQQTYASLADRWQYVGQVEWQASYVEGIVLFMLSAPLSFIGNVNLDAFQRFTYWSGDMEVRVELQSQPFQQGQLIMYFVPETTSSDVLAEQALSRTVMTVCPHVKFCAGGSRSVTLRIPFVHRKNRLNLINAGDLVNNSCGIFVCQVFNSLQVAVDAIQTSAILNMFVRLPSSHFTVLRLMPVLGLLEFAAKSRVIKDRSDGFVDVDEKEGVERRESRGFALGKKRGKSVVQGGYISTAANVVNIAAAGIDFARVADRNGRAIQNRNLDYPNVGTNAVQTVRMGGLDLANGRDQMGACRVLDVGPSRGDILTHQDVGSSAEEMSIEYLASKATFFESFEWTAGDSVGDILYTGIATVTPGMMGGAIGNPYQPTLMEYVMLPHMLWRADLIVKLEVVSTQFHSGRLAFVTRYGDFSNSTDIDEALTQYVQVLDVSATQTCFEIPIPWLSDREMLRVNNHPGYDDAHDFALGSYEVVVLSGLQYGGVSDRVEINVYLAAKNVQYDFPGFGTGYIEVLNPHDPPPPLANVGGDVAHSQERVLRSCVASSGKTRKKKSKPQSLPL